MVIGELVSFCLIATRNPLGRKISLLNCFKLFQMRNIVMIFKWTIIIDDQISEMMDFYGMVVLTFV